jgi:hypothetical protein
VAGFGKCSDEPLVSGSMELVSFKFTKEEILSIVIVVK